MSRSNPQRDKRIFNDAQIENLTRFGEILQRIHDRLVDEGYFVDPKRRIWDIFKVAKPLPTIVDEGQLEQYLDALDANNQ